jgi:hypothetical protein
VIKTCGTIAAESTEEMQEVFFDGIAGQLRADRLEVKNCLAHPFDRLHLNNYQQFRVCTILLGD